MWAPDQKQGDEAAKIRGFIVPYTRGAGLDIGCGPFKAFPHFIGIDSGEDNGGRAYPNTLHGDGQNLKKFADGGLDFVFSSHFLEHCEETVATLREWWRVIRPGGFLVLYLPHADLYPRMGEPGSNPDHKHDFHPDDILGAMKHVKGGWNLLENETRGDGEEYSFFQVYQKRDDDKHIETPWRRPEKSCLVIRYGAIGDHIMAQSILPELKKQGYHVTYNCNDAGFDIVRYHESVDAFIVQDKGQVPNEWLGGYWAQLASRYDRVVNLSESIETTLLPNISLLQFHYPDDTRRRLFNVNYLERTHDIAGVPYAIDTRFRALESEIRAAGEAKQRITGGRPLVLLALSGSAQHKTWPYWHILVGWLLDHTNVQVMTTGSAEEVQLERAILYAYLLAKGYTEERVKALDQKNSTTRLVQEVAKFDKLGVTRIFNRAGKMPIRGSLAMAQVADLVIGPETGMLNAVGQEPNAKIVFLSHSSPENLTKYWANCRAMTPERASCWPCHRMHITLDFCPQSPDWQSALCCAGIEPEAVYMAAVEMLGLQRVNPPRRSLSATLSGTFLDGLASPPPTALGESIAEALNDLKARVA